MPSSCRRGVSLVAGETPTTEPGNPSNLPFGRTPKVLGRTAAPPLYVAAEYALLGWCVLGMVVDLLAARWGHAAFAGLNGAFFGYALWRFIGFRESLADLAQVRPGSLAPPQPASARPVPLAGPP